MRAYYASAQARFGRGPTAVDLGVSIPLITFLIWFTYFSKNRLVKDSDRFTVFLMLCGGALGLILIVARHTLHLF